jgi:UDP-3-O-[3-hydroxymyristoyl] glucosamine N-acyltransferase
MSLQLSDIARAIGASAPPDGAAVPVHALTAPEQAGGNDIVFSMDPRFDEAIDKSRAGFVIVKRGRSFNGKVCLEVDDPYAAYAKTAQLFEDRSPAFGAGIAPSAVIDATASIDPTASIGPGSVVGARVRIGAKSRIGARCVIEKGCTLGTDCRIDSGVVIRYDTVIGDRVVIQSGAVIGSDGFGNAREKGIFIRIPAFGNVIIGDDADIGANTTIDRGNFAPTVIGKGVKLDNLIHIAHNVTVDEHTAIAAQTGVSGSTRIGKRVLIAGQAGFVGHIEIGDDSFIGAKAGVSKSVPAGAKITGYPARDLMAMRRVEAAQQELPAMLKDLKKMRARLDALEKSVHLSDTMGMKGPEESS